MTHTVSDDHHSGSSEATSPAEGQLIAPTWFGPPGQPLFGWLHTPRAGTTRGGVVICPPVGNELPHAHYSIRLLAGALAERGFSVVRFDYAGTGDSSGDDEIADRTAAALASVGDAIDLARRAGNGRVSLVGLRLGATLAATAVAGGEAIEAIVLWDPCVSGNAFLREQRALLALTPTLGAATKTTGVETPGHAFSAATIAGLRELDLRKVDGRLARRVLVLSDPTRVTDAAIAEWAQATSAETAEYAARLPVFDIGEPGFEAPIPIIEQITAWVESAAAAPAAPLPQVELTPTATVAHDDAGGPIVETAEFFGPAGIFGITTTSTREPDTDVARPTILLLSTAAEPRSGPSRMWTTLARTWAPRGFRVVRIDLSGIGDSPARPGCGERLTYVPEALDDVVDVAHAISPDDPANLILMGLCSGGNTALEAGALLRPRRIIAVNPVLTLPQFSRIPRGSQGRIARPSETRSNQVGRRWFDTVPAAFQPLAWKLLYRLYHRFAPQRMLVPLMEARIPTLLICGPDESRALRERLPGQLRRLTANGDIQLAFVPHLDHSILWEASRATVAELATAFIEGSVHQPRPSG